MKVQRYFKIIIGLIITIAISGCSVFGARSVEEPKYKSLSKKDNFEIREYDKMIIAKTFVKEDYDKSSSKAFRKIADYIFGNNQSNKKISMTAPVVQEAKKTKIAMTAPVVQEKGNNGWYMYFIMPKKYNMTNLPKPVNKDVIIEELPEKTVAVYSYSGFTNEEKIKKYGDKLKKWAKDKGYKTVSDPRSARYNPPITLPFMRTNEVHIDIVKKQ